MSQYPHRALYRFYLVLVAVLVFGVLVGVGLALTYKDELPSIEEIYNIEPPVVTTIYDIHGEVLQKFHYENRTLVPYSKIPPHLIHALVATEDDGFYRHWGVDWRGFMRAVFRNLFAGFGSAGGSTITQQLSRMLFYNREMSLERKIKEALTAIKIERTYSKNEILEMYLNTYYYGHGAYGIETASRAYFNKSAENLKIEESALLVAILNAPARYSPINHPDRALGRRNYVLSRMTAEGYLQASLADSLKQLPLDLNLALDNTGQAPYFTEMVRQYLVDKYGEDTFYGGGLAVYTTLDAGLQRVVESSLKIQVDSLQRRMQSRKRYNDPEFTVPQYDSTGKLTGYAYKEVQGAFVAIDNRTGDLMTLVGGKDFAKWKFNRAVQAQRQPGSSFKPFVYMAAIAGGFHPCDILYDTPIALTIPGSDVWSPKNFDGEFLGAMTMRKGLAMSRNLIAIKLMQKIGADKAIEYARKMGITSPLTPNAALAIGTSEVSLLELVSAYTSFANLGIRVEPRYILKIVDRYGNVLEQNDVAPRRSVADPAETYVTVSMLRSVMDDREGTAASARSRGFQRPAAGKTGTSDNFCDNWFVGFTPQITAGTWIGYDDKTSIGYNQAGSTNALPIWCDFMIAAHENLPVEDFPEPPGIVHLAVCPQSGKLATSGCPNMYDEVFLQNQRIEEYCPIHKGRRGL
ncbi:MAG: PBP1A family penicillin-binding protein [candidate division Zixibacteria bacterium]|nr:PBP1A family penicillin-binding protein [candidate division Zixibacteria bacterium]